MSNGKIIRDSVHGDIFIEQKFLDLIETPEFQRLRRIHQLSVANLVFPSAEHTRFSHSIGTFHVMKLIIDHFEEVFNEVNIVIGDRDKNLCLSIALLHDIGHGPFSHAFEGISKDSHEEWTKKIILSEEALINKILKSNFDNDFPNDLVELINKERLIKSKGFKGNKDQKIDLFFVMSSLISSQLDADRLDYLLRDSLNSGVKFGNIDISRIIKSMGITIYKENLYVCIGDKYLPDIEAYLLSRFQMHESIYFHDNKCEMELIIEKIFMRIEQLYNLGELTGIVPKELIPILKKQEMNIKDYIELDDYMMISLFKSLYKVEDNVLKELCAAILYRKKYKRVEIMDNGFGYVDKFKLNLVNLLNKYNYQVKDMEKEYFWLEKDIKNVMYKDNKENIWIISTNGIVSDISEVSNLVNVQKEKSIHFISYDILYNLIPYEQLELFKNELKQIIDSYNSRNHIEIESKYLILKELKEDIIISLEETDKYKVSNKTKVIQTDVYYDTNDFKLLEKKISLRMREIDNRYYLTVKLPTIKGVNERFEYEFLVDDKNLINNLDLFDEYLNLDILNLLKDTKPVLNIINEREKYDIYEKDILFELVIDNVRYINQLSSREYSETQLEIELKGGYCNRVNLKGISDYLVNKFNNIKSLNESKYTRGIKFTK